jgi:hypothetical protein
MYAKVVWAKVVKAVKISTYSGATLLKGFDQTRGCRNIRCRWDQKKTMSLACDGWVAWWVVLGGVIVRFTLYMICTPRVLSPFKVGASSLIL